MKKSLLGHNNLCSEIVPQLRVVPTYDQQRANHENTLKYCDEMIAFWTAQKADTALRMGKIMQEQANVVDSK